MGRFRDRMDEDQVVRGTLLAKLEKAIDRAEMAVGAISASSRVRCKLFI